jgi:hypothetical protein
MLHATRQRLQFSEKGCIINKKSVWEIAMDIFCEQIVQKKKTTFEKLTVALIWLGGWMIAMLLILVGLTYVPRFFMLLVLAAIGAIYGAMKLSSRLNIEYEYSVTNGVLDVDKIINRSDRKRLLSAEISAFDKFEEFVPEKRDHSATQYDSVVTAVADPGGQDGIYVAVYRHPVKGRILLVFQPGERVLSTILKALPRHMQIR